MKTRELIKAIKEQTNFIVLALDEGPLKFCYPLHEQEGSLRSEILATLPQEALSMQEFKQKDIDWDHYEYLKPKQREVTKFYELLNKYTETPIIDRVDDSYFWTVYAIRIAARVDDAISNSDKNAHQKR